MRVERCAITIRSQVTQAQIRRSIEFAWADAAGNIASTAACWMPHGASLIQRKLYGPAQLNYNQLESLSTISSKIVMGPAAVRFGPRLTAKRWPSCCQRTAPTGKVNR